MPTLAITMTGHDEAHLLPRAMESVRWADALIYVDCGSSDDSLAVARRYTEQVFSRPNTTNLNVNKAYAMDQAASDWIFYLDPDEVISSALAGEIRRVIASDPPQNAFKLPRRNHVYGTWLRHGGQYPDTQLRLFRRGKARFPCRHVHERLEVDGAVGQLTEAMDHHTIDSPMTAIRKMDFFSTFNAENLVRSGVRPTSGVALQYLVFKPASRFWRRWLFKGGFLDGWPGLIQAAISSIDFQFRFFKLWYLAHHPEAMQERNLPGAAPEQSSTRPGRVG